MPVNYWKSGSERENTMCRKTEEEMKRKRVKFTSNRPGAGLVGYANNREHDLNENWKKKQLGHGAGADLPFCLHLTFTAPLHLSHGCQGISQKVREPSV